MDYPVAVAVLIIYLVFVVLVLIVDIRKIIRRAKEKLNLYSSHRSRAKSKLKKEKEP